MPSAGDYRSSFEDTLLFRVKTRYLTLYMDLAVANRKVEAHGHILIDVIADIIADRPYSRYPPVGRAGEREFAQSDAPRDAGGDGSMSVE